PLLRPPRLPHKPRGPAAARLPGRQRGTARPALVGRPPPPPPPALRPRGGRPLARATRSRVGARRLAAVPPLRRQRSRRDLRLRALPRAPRARPLALRS